MMSTWIALVLAVVGIVIATCRKGSLLESVSEMSYVIEHWAFSSWITLVGILLLPDMMEHLDDRFQWVGFLSVVGLMCVAASSYYRTENKLLHYAGGFLCGVCASFVVGFIDWHLLFGWVAYVIYLIVCLDKHYTFYAEMMVFLQLIIALLI